jgi:hypothetical protein
MGIINLLKSIIHDTIKIDINFKTNLKKRAHAN